MLAQVFGRFTRALAGTPGDLTWNLRLCLATTSILGMDGAAMTVAAGPPGPEIVCATDPFVERLENVQIVLGEGPSMEALRARRPVYSTPQELVDRWPVLARTLNDELESAFVVALPMRPAREVIGVLTLHGRQPKRPEVDLEEAQQLADLVAVSALGTLVGPEESSTDWLTRDRLNQAVGVVVAQLRVTPTDALAVLRTHAYAHDATLAAVVEQVRSGTIDFGTAGNGADPREGDQ